MTRPIVAFVAMFLLVLVLAGAGGCNSPKGQSCPSRGSIKVRSGQTYHCQPGPGGGLSWQ